MNIVIDIDEKTYEQLKFLTEQGFGTLIDEAVANGIPLPKGHKIIDATAFVAHTDTGGTDEWDDYACYLVDKEPAIIGSESEEINEDSD